MRVVFTRAAEKSLVRLPAARQRQIISRIEAVAADPGDRRQDVRRLAGSDLLRLRVGGFRVLFSLDDRRETMTIELIRTRGDVYKR
jgi:mRNA interferase RelE/StbE